MPILQKGCHVVDEDEVMGVVLFTLTPIGNCFG